MTTPDEPDLTAAELALGVLEGDERAAALRRVIADPAFAREVERWRDRLGVLHAEWPDATPSDATDRRLRAIPAHAGGSERRWKAVAAVSGLAAALLLAVLVSQQTDQRPPLPSHASLASALVAVVKPTGGRPVGIAIDPTTRRVRVVGQVDTPAGHDAELWLIGSNGVPHSVGLIRPGRALVLGATDVAGPGATLAVSIEPAGGSPKPTPTGPVVGTGTLAAI